MAKERPAPPPSGADRKRPLAGILRSPAVLQALITALVGPVVVLVVTRALEPGTIKKTKDDISAVTVSDQALRRLGGSIVFVRTPDGSGATGFIWKTRWVVTTSRLAGKVSSPVTVVRRKGLPDEHGDGGRVSVVDPTNLIALVDMKRVFDEVQLPAPHSEPPQVFDKVFALVYSDTTFLTLREGRILSLAADRGNGRRVIVADFPVTIGMAGAPVFSKDGQMVGMVTGADLKMQITYIVPIRQIEYSFEQVGG